MDTTYVSIAVLFDDPFWIGLIERMEGNRLTVCKITFGAEPRDAEVYDFLCRQYGRLQFSPAVSARVVQTRSNPKRVQREIRRQLRNTGIGTKSQQALQLQREQNKQERRTQSRERLLAEKERRFALRQQKKREKHRGH